MKEMVDKEEQKKFEDAEASNNDIMSDSEGSSDESDSTDSEDSESDSSSSEEEKERPDESYENKHGKRVLNVNRLKQIATDQKPPVGQS